MKEKIVSILLTSSIVAGALVGCGSSSGTASTSSNVSTTDSSTSTESSSETASTDNGDSGTAQTTTSETGTVTLTMDFHYPEDFYNETVVPIIQDFKKDHPELKDVVYHTLSGATDQQQVTRLTGGEYGDICLIPSVLSTSEVPNYFAP